MNRPFATAAADLARGGFRVFRISPGKKTGGSRWVHGPDSEVATNDVAEIERRAQLYPTSNIGVATGRGFVVLDLDEYKLGYAGRPDWAPQTRTSRTASGGTHLWFKTDPFYLKCSAGRIAPGVDVRGDGGMVLAPPSVTEDGAYAWVNDLPLAYLPASRFTTYTVGAAPGGARGGAIRRPEGIGDGDGRHSAVLSFAVYLAGSGCEAEEVWDLCWQYAARFKDPVWPPRHRDCTCPGCEAGANVASAVRWVLTREQKSREKQITELTKSQGDVPAPATAATVVASEENR